jgi:hypothetical protein
MPMAQEYRVFWLDGSPVFWAPYWALARYGAGAPPIRQFAGIAAAVRSRFFTMDLAQRRDGDWMVVEIGDGQVSGPPNGSDAGPFYEALDRHWSRGDMGGEQ